VLQSKLNLIIVEKGQNAIRASLCNYILPIIISNCIRIALLLSYCSNHPVGLILYIFLSEKGGQLVLEALGFMPIFSQ
jgi:hypothetical protein